MGPLETHELQGFFRGTTVKNKFKFIRKTSEIQEHRGDHVDDGILRVEFAFEKPKPDPEITKIIKEEHHHYHYHGGPYDQNVIYRGTPWYSTTDVKFGQKFTHNVACDQVGVQSMSSNLNAPLSDEGITVKGSVTNIEYRYGAIGELEDSSVIIITLKGMQQSSGVVVQDPITVKSKVTCSSCGRKWKTTFKYCPNCGTYLE